MDIYYFSIARISSLALLFFFSGCTVFQNHCDQMPGELREAIEEHENIPEGFRLGLKEDRLIEVHAEKNFHLNAFLKNESRTSKVLSHHYMSLILVMIYRDGEIYNPYSSIFNFLSIGQTTKLNHGERFEREYEFSLSEPGRYYAVAIARKFMVGETLDDIVYTPPEKRSPDYWMFTEPLEIRVE